MTQQGEILTTPADLAPQTIAETIAWHAARQPKRLAIVGSDFASFSFGELNQHIREVGKQLRAAGIGSLSRVGIALPKCPEAALLGVSIAAHTNSVPLNPSLTTNEFTEEIKRCKLDAIVLPQWRQSSASAAAQNGSLGIFHISKAAGDLSKVALHQVRDVPGPRQAAVSASARSTALILKTSGTTGNVKLVPVTHENLLEMASKMRRWFNLSSEDRCACILPTYYAAGLKTTLLIPLLLGGSVALPATAHPEDLAGWITDLRPTWFSTTPALLLAILDKLRSGAGERLDHSLRFILSSSAYLPEAVRTELEDRSRGPNSRVLRVKRSRNHGCKSRASGQA